MALQYEPVLPSTRFNHDIVQAHFVLSLASLFGYKKYLEIGEREIDDHTICSGCSDADHR
jgi:hypothetical protein